MFRSRYLFFKIYFLGYYIHQKVKENEDREKNPEKYKQQEEINEKRKKFYTQLKMILKIVFPSIYSKEFGILLAHTAVLLCKTFLSIYIAQLDGSIVKKLVDRKGKEFLMKVLQWMLVAIPASYSTSLIIYLEKKLSIALRTRLSNYSYELYMKNQTYYAVSNLDNRLTNADQCLTEDVKLFCDGLAHVHSQLSKPILDIILNMWELSSLAQRDGNGNGAISLFVGFIIVWTTNFVLKLIRPRFGKLVSEQAELEGKLRFAHSRLITNSQEIAFYRGEKVEHNILINSYMSLAKHMNHLFKSKIFYTLIEQFSMKYWWAACGTVLVSLPAFYYEKSVENASSTVVSNRTESYITAKNLLVFGAGAIERIMLANKEISELSGYTDRVATMLKVFDDCSNGNYVKKKIEHSIPKGKLITGSDYIKFDNVAIVTPSGDVLVKSLSFEIRKGQHLLITGPNGCGKSSMFRMLGELWPVYGGTLTKPSLNNMFYIPQRPYLVIGSLRDQIIYPDTYQDMLNKGFKDEHILEICKNADLIHISEKEGLESQKDWNEMLSGGEKQRVGLARLYYHRPAFAILDECTSSISMDWENKLYQHTIDLGITLITVTHRPSLWKFHNYLLQYDGQGGIVFSELNASERLSFKEEKGKLEQKLQTVAKMEQRLHTLCEMLGEETPVLNQ